MDEALSLGRLQFAFTITYHYLFPQLTIGLSLIIVILKGIGLRTGIEHYHASARFWMKIFALSFGMGVVTGIPMEFQFGTNWARFSTFAGGIVGQTLAMEGVFAFFLESSFLGLFLFGEKRLGPRLHFLTAVVVCFGSWLSAWFIVATNAWMQHPVGYVQDTAGNLQLGSLSEVFLNPWLYWQYAHTVSGSVVTAGFVVAAVGAWYVLSSRHVEAGRTYLRIGVIAGGIGAVLCLFPTGDMQGKNLAKYQPVTLAAMEGLFETKEGAELVLIGQPDMERLRIDNPIAIPRLLSFLTYHRWDAEIRGLDAFPREDWPDNIPLLYYSYHIMVGLGTMLIALGLVSIIALRGGRLFRMRWLLWLLMLSFPFPFIANTAGWYTAELGRQPWLVYGLLRTSEGSSPLISAGNTLFTLIGFMGLYFVLGLVYLFLVGREVAHGPAAAAEA